jgi:hypothetical protein
VLGVIVMMVFVVIQIMVISVVMIPVVVIMIVVTARRRHKERQPDASRHGCFKQRGPFHISDSG